MSWVCSNKCSVSTVYDVGDRHSKSFDDHADMEHVSGHDDIQHRPDCDDIMEGNVCLI